MIWHRSLMRLCHERCQMFADMPPLPDVAAFIAPHEVEKRKGRSSARTAAIVIGTVLILSDGSECVVTAFDANGNPLCAPVGQ